MNKSINKIRTFVSEDNISMLLGIVIVVLVGSLLFSYFKSVNKTGKINNQAVTTENVTLEDKAKNLPADYEVQAGDSLWSISERVYGTGYNWTEIYAANIETVGANPSLLESGVKITLPKIEVKTVEYTVVAGDNLWNIAVKTCSNGYLWPKISADNKLTNANLIQVGQVFKINCQ